MSKEDVIDEFGEKIKFVIDGGKSNIGLESTIISLVDSPRILRLGGLDKKILNNSIDSKKSKKNYPKIIVPGQGKIHYSPDIPIRLNVSKAKKNEAFLLVKKRKEKNKNFFYLSKNKDMKEVGKNFYSMLRKIKNSNFKSIAVEKIPCEGIGETVNDRLIRASKKK